MAPRRINRPGYSRSPTGINRPGYSSSRAPTGTNRPGYSSSRAPTGTNRPGYSSPKAPTGVNRPGTSSPDFSGYSRPEKDNKPQPAGGSGGSGGSGSLDNAAIAQQFNVTQPGEAYRDTGGTAQDFQKDLQKAAQFGLFTQHPYTKELMQKYNLNTQDVINLRLGTGSGGVGRADPSKLYNKYATNPSQLGVFQKVLGSGMIPMAMGPGNLAQQGIGAFKEGMSVYDYPPSRGFKDSLGKLIGSRFNFIAGGSPYGVAALGFGRNALGLEGDQLNQFASSVANDRNLYNLMMTQPYMKDQQFRNLMYNYQQQSNRNRDRGGQPVVSPPVVGPKFVESDLKQVNPYLEMVKRYQGDQPIFERPFLFAASGGIATLN